MKTESILPLTLLVLAITGSATEAFAWDKHFTGTRAQVVNACSGANMVLINGATHSTCKNLANGNYVDCNDAGQCSGGGTGPDPTRVKGTNPIRGMILGALEGGAASAEETREYGGGSTHHEPNESREVEDGPPGSGAGFSPQWHSNAGTIL